MTETHRFLGHVEGGKVRLDDMERWRSFTRSLEGKRVEVTLGRLRQTRSLTQNAYLWAAVYSELASWSGHSDIEIHVAMKEMFCPEKEISLPSGEVVRVKSTRLLNTEEHSEYISRVKLFGAENGVTFREPEQVA